MPKIVESLLRRAVQAIGKDVDDINRQLGIKSPATFILIDGLVCGSVRESFPMDC